MATAGGLHIFGILNILFGNGFTMFHHVETPRVQVTMTWKSRLLQSVSPSKVMVPTSDAPKGADGT